MFACFVCDLLGFRAREFPAKYEKKPGHLSLAKSCIPFAIDNTMWRDDLLRSTYNRNTFLVFNRFHIPCNNRIYAWRL